MPSRDGDDPLVEEMLGTAGPELPNLPVMLGDLTEEETRGMGAWVHPRAGPGMLDRRPRPP